MLAFVNLRIAFVSSSTKYNNVGRKYLDNSCPRIRPLWRSYTRCTDGIIFVVDSAEEERLDEAKVELWRTMKYQDNKDIPLLVLANKQDLQSALSAADIEDALGELRPMTLVDNCPISS